MLPPMVTTPPFRLRFELPAAPPLPPPPRLTPAAPMFTTPPPTVKSEVRAAPAFLPLDITRPARLATPVSNRNEAVAAPVRPGELPIESVPMLRSA